MISQWIDGLNFAAARKTFLSQKKWKNLCIITRFQVLTVLTSLILNIATVNKNPTIQALVQN